MSCVNSIVVPAPADQVWAALRDFHDLSWGEPVVTGVERVGEEGPHEVGARRVINGVFHETLRSFDDEGRKLSYSIEQGPPPIGGEVTGYEGCVRVFPVTATGETFVLWTSSWTGPTEEAAALCNPIYQALLNALREHFAG